MKLITCALWIVGSVLAGVLLVAGHLATLPGRAVVAVAQMMLDWLGE